MGILRHHSDEGQTGGVHSVVNGGPKLPQQLGLNSVHHQMNLVQEGQLLHCPLGVPQGGRVAGGHHDGPVRTGAGQAETAAQTGGGVDEHIVIGAPGLIEHRLNRLLADGAGQLHGGGEQPESGQVRVAHHSPFQRHPPQSHVGEVQQGPVVEPQSDVQIPQADVHVDTKDLPAYPGEGRGNPSGDGSFSGASFSGGNDDHNAHSASGLLYLPIVIYHILEVRQWFFVKKS